MMYAYFLLLFQLIHIESYISFLRQTRTVTFRRFEWNSKKIDDMEDDGKTFATLQQWSENVYQQISNSTRLKEVSIEPDYQEAEGILSRDKVIRYSVKAYESRELKYFRSVSFHGNGFHVLNILALPNLSVCPNLPILGIDIVSLPGNLISYIMQLCSQKYFLISLIQGETLANIDFQPTEFITDYFTLPIYTENTSKLKKWTTSILPSGGPLPPQLAKYFSPLSLWTKFPSKKKDLYFFLIETALKDYTNLYLEQLILHESTQKPLTNISMITDSETTTNLMDNNSVLKESIIKRRKEGIVEYLNYRIVNDPAKKLLHAAFGIEWTEKTLGNYLFPKDLFE
jgi:hypothetical protein